MFCGIKVLFILFFRKLYNILKKVLIIEVGNTSHYFKMIGK